MLRGKLILLALTGLLLSGCYTQLQMSKGGEATRSTARSYETVQDRNFYSFNFVGYSNYWGNFYYDRMGSYFARNWMYRDSVYPYNYYQFYSYPQSGFVGGVQERDNNRPRSIGTNRVSTAENRGERSNTDGNRNRSTVGNSTTSDTDQTRSRNRQSEDSSDDSRERSREEQRQDTRNRILLNQLQLAEDLNNRQYDASERDLRKAEVGFRAGSDRFDRELGAELSRYLKNNQSSTYDRLKSFFEAQRRANLQGRVNPFQNDGYERTRSYHAGGDKKRYRNSSSDSGNSRSRSSSSSSSSSRSRSGGDDGGSSSGSDRSRGNN